MNSLDVDKPDMTSPAIALNQSRTTWRPVIVHSARTAVAAVASFLAAKPFRLPEPHWEPITVRGADKAGKDTGHVTDVAAKDTAKGTDKVAKKTGHDLKKAAEKTEDALK